MIKHKLENLTKNQKGVLLISVLVIATILILIGFSLTSFTVSQYSVSNNKVFSTNALMVAEAGVEDAVRQMNESDSYTGATDVEFFNNQTQGKGTYTTVVTDLATDAKQIVSTGTVYRYGHTSPESSRIVKVTIVGTNSSGYSVHTGPGGLILGGSANITNSDVYVNGTITMTGTSKIGTYDQPVNVDVAYQACPTGSNPGPTYPSVCTTGQPISTAYSTAIYGSVCATNQTDTNYPSGNPAGNILPGSTGQGLILGCTAPTVSTPTYDRQAQINAVTTTASSTDNNYLCQHYPFTRSWPANLKLTGSVNIGGSCDITVNGNVYITGNLNIGGASKIRVADSVGATRPVIMVDGTIDVQGSAQMIANSSGTGIHFISFKSTGSCSPNCNNLNGTELKLSQDLLTVSVDGAINLPGMVFQAYWSKVKIGGSGSVGAAIGQTVDLSGAGTVTFGTELSAGSRTWTITSYQQEFPD